MKPLALCVAFLFAMLTASPAVAQAVSAGDLQRFVERYKLDVPSTTSTDWDDLLYLSATSARTPEQVVAEFAQRIGASPAMGREYASVILATALSDKVCDTRPRPTHCVFAPGQRRYERAASRAMADRSGNLLVALAKRNALTRQDQATLLTLIASHPSAPSTFARLFEFGRHNREPAFLLAAAASGPIPGRLAQLAVTSTPSSFYWPTHDYAWRQALLESVEASAERDGASPRTRAALAHVALSWKLEFGLIDEAVASYYAYPPGVRALLRLPGGCVDTAEQCQQVDHYRLGDELGAALWLTGHKDDARKWIRKAIPGFGSRSRGAEARYLALTEAVSPTHSAEDLFSLFVGSSRMGSPWPGKGLVFEARAGWPALRRVVARRLRTAGYGSMATYLEEPLPAYQFTPDPLLAAVAKIFPRSVSRRQEYWFARMTAALAQQHTRRAPGPARVSTRALPAWWIEKPLPDSTRPWRSGDAKQETPRGADLPVPRDAVLRYEERNGERAIVYLSTEYDLPGETSAAGIWFAKTTGGIWDRALYLGLQQNFPYVVTPASRLPLLDGQRLRLEVRIREIDPASITLPPVALALKRSADGLYIEFNLATLAADRDADGLTDIAERRIGLDFINPDTDGDGVPDGRDPLPLVRYRRTSSGSDRLARVIVSELVGPKPRPMLVGVAPALDRVRAGLRSGGAPPPSTRTRFLIADPAMFAGVATPFPLIVYSPADVAALDRGGAPFYPAAVWLLFSSLDGRHHYVGWHAAPRGGSFFVACEGPADACTVRDLGTWIS